MTIFFMLGNFGYEYTNTVHNIGSDMFFYLLKTEKIKLSFYDKFGKVATDGKTKFCVLNCYMNVSGDALKHFLKQNKDLTKEKLKLVIVYDDIALDVGKIKISQGFGDSGHNGIKNIKKNFKECEVIRLRIGVGRPTENLTVNQFVTHKLSNDLVKYYEQLFEIIYSEKESIIKCNVGSLYKKIKELNLS